MAKIEIEWLWDSGHNCETCGTSYAEGARVIIDGKVELELKPVAHCFGGDNWDQGEVYEEILKKLGHEVTYFQSRS